MRFAFIIMGDFDYQKDYASINNSMAQIIGVKNLDEAVEIAIKLQKDGVNCIELCGAFGETGAKRIIAATNNTIPVGYVTHLPIQDDVYQKAFKNKTFSLNKNISNRRNNMNNSLEKAERLLISAGMSFFVYHIEEILTNFNRIEDKEEKSKLIKKIYETQVGFFDKNISGTRTRVNSVINIIKLGQEETMIQKIAKSQKVSPDIITKANQLLKKLF